MKLRNLHNWISSVEAQRGDLEHATSTTTEDILDRRPPKRRRLSSPLGPRKKAKSDGSIDYNISAPFSQSHAVPGFDDMKRASALMGPPASPARTRNNKSRRPSDVGIEDASTRSSASSHGITSTGYREEVLRPNGIMFERPHFALPDHVKNALHQFREHGVPQSPSDTAFTPMSLEEAERFIEMLYTSEAGPEEGFTSLLCGNLILPPGDQIDGLTRVPGQLFKSDGLPRSRFPDKIYPVSTPKPDYAYGYTGRVLDHDQHAEAQSFIYKPYTDLYWPFLIVEAESQAMNRCTYQAANQCAGGGTVCLNAVATLMDAANAACSALKDVSQGQNKSLDQFKLSETGSVDHKNPRNSQSLDLPSSKAVPFSGTYVSPDSTAGNAQGGPQFSTNPIVFSLAIDTKFAELYVHWRSADKRTFHLQQIDTYVIVRPEELIKLQNKIRQIITWGMNHRLPAIKRALDVVVEDQFEKRRLMELQLEQNQTETSSVLSGKSPLLYQYTPDTPRSGP